MCLACVVVASAQAVGVILVVAMLITPGATAYLLTQKFPVMLVLSPLLAWLSCVIGIAASFTWDVSTGGAIVLSQALMFALVYLFGPREGVVWRATVVRRWYPGVAGYCGSPLDPVAGLLWLATKTCEGGLV